MTPAPTGAGVSFRHTSVLQRVAADITRARGGATSAGAVRSDCPRRAACPMPTPRPPADDDRDFVTVARRLDPIAAELLRGRLAADGIPARLADAHLVQTYSLGAAALGGVRVMVPASWTPQALRAIAAVEQGALALDEEPLAGVEGVPDERAPEDLPGAAPLQAAVPWMLATAAVLLVFMLVSALARSPLVVP